MHSIQARLVGESPWGWRDATVALIDGRWPRVTYVETGTTARLWHHESLARFLEFGLPVRVHERFHVFAGPFGWVSVVVRDGLRPVPEPTAPKLWQNEKTAGVVDLQTGRGWDVKQ